MHSVGSIISLEFESAMSLLIFCAWRLDRESQVTATSQDSAQVIETVRQALVGQSILAAAPITAAGDLALEFSGGLILRVFCDLSIGKDNFNIEIDGNAYGWSRGPLLTSD
jgi:hypothetical protein